MKQFIFSLICYMMIACCPEIQAQTDIAKSTDNEYVLTVGGEGVTLEDFKHIYGKTTVTV